MFEFIALLIGVLFFTNIELSFTPFLIALGIWLFIIEVGIKRDGKE